MKMISIISPFCNEKDNLVELVERILKTLNEYYDRRELEIIMVDDGSSDGGNIVVRKLSEKYAGVKLITHHKKMGKAAALSSGFSLAQGDIIITMDSDLQGIPEEIPLFLERMNKGYDLVNGIRLRRKETLFLRLCSKILSLLVSIFLKILVRDVSSNFTAVKKEFVNGLSLSANDHRYIIPIMHKRGAVRIIEVGIRHAKRLKGKSNYRVSKIVSAVPEFFSFYFRLKKGLYDLN
jgi:glycosyltransferase involved in cell wall biosynthesis